MEKLEKMKLEMANYSVAGTVTDIVENESTLLGEKETLLFFKFFDKKQQCVAKVGFGPSSSLEPLYKAALRFVKKLRNEKIKSVNK